MRGLWIAASFFTIQDCSVDNLITSVPHLKSLLRVCNFEASKIFECRQRMCGARHGAWQMLCLNRTARTSGDINCQTGFWRSFLNDLLYHVPIQLADCTCTLWTTLFSVVTFGGDCSASLELFGGPTSCDLWQLQRLLGAFRGTNKENASLCSSTFFDRCTSACRAVTSEVTPNAGNPSPPSSSLSMHSLASCPALRRSPFCTIFCSAPCRRSPHHGLLFDPLCQLHACSFSNG